MSAVVNARMLPTISVIVPAYNAARFIQEALNSVLAQTLQPSEILVIDDGSTDKTRDVVASLESQKINYVLQENRGVSSARNRGLELATGEFIAFLDADDIWHQDMLELQHKLLESDASLVCAIANFVRFDSSTGEIMPEQFSFYPELKNLPMSAGPTPGTHVLVDDPFTKLVVFGDIPAFTQTMMFRRLLIEDLRFNERLRICEDMEFAMRAFLRGAVAFNAAVLAKIRRHDANVTFNYQHTAPHKLEALRSFRTDDLNEPQMVAYSSRLTRAYIDAGRVLARKGNFIAGISLLREGGRGRGDYVRKIKGLLRILSDGLAYWFRTGTKKVGEGTEGANRQGQG
jgi:glycosyltransferase involved in cell wall biosynthesis